MNLSSEQLQLLLRENPDLVMDTAVAAQPRGEAAVSPKRSRRRSRDYTPRLLSQIAAAGLPAPRLEYVFHAQRKWRFDLCWKDRLVACEIEGGIWMQTETGRSKGHAHPKRFLQDIDKYNEAALYGWTLIRVTPAMIRDGRALELLKRALIDD